MYIVETLDTTVYFVRPFSSWGYIVNELQILLQCTSCRADQQVVRMRGECPQHASWRVIQSADWLPAHTLPVDEDHQVLSVKIPI